MLKRFKVKNFKNFGEEFTLDLSQTKSYAFNSECVVNGIAKTALIYGPNGCGKSNLALAIFDLKNHLTDDKIPKVYQRNFLYAGSGGEPARFDFLFQVKGHDIQYSYSKSTADQLIHETFSIDGKTLISIDRHKSTEAFIDLKGAESLNRDLGSHDFSVIKYVRNNSVIQSALEDLALEVVLSTAEHMQDVVFFSMDSEHRDKFFNRMILSSKKINPGGLKNFEMFLNEAGMDCRLSVVEVDGEEEVALQVGDQSINFFKNASKGTLSLTEQYIALGYFKIVDEMPGGGVFPALLFLDEFDAFYHHKVSRMMVEAYKTMNVQVILTTHNTSIMSNDLLRPDCCFIMDHKEARPLHSFTEKELRKAHNIEKMYRAGAFDG